jgi:hypothetical protein
MPNLGLQLTRTANIFSGASFLPTDLPELELWLDANEGVLNFVGNNFTDATASIEVVWSGVTSGQTAFVLNQINGKNSYGSTAGGIGLYIQFTGTRWFVEGYDVSGEDVQYLGVSLASLGNEDYPWQATWPSGTTVTRTATTVDDPAANDETVTRWDNLVSGKPNLSQLSANLQPVFKSNVNGRKAVFFNGDVLSSSEFSSFGQQYSYYLVATNLAGSSGSISGAIRLGTSSITTRGMFGGTGTFIGAHNGTSRVSTLSNDAGGHNIWSARFNVGNSGEAIVGSKKTHQTLASVGTSSANFSTLLLGATNSAGANAITSNYSEVLVYRAFHDETTANKIIDYLAAKWSITL